MYLTGRIRTNRRTNTSKTKGSWGLANSGMYIRTHTCICVINPRWSAMECLTFSESMARVSQTYKVRPWCAAKVYMVYYGNAHCFGGVWQNTRIYRVSNEGSVFNESASCCICIFRQLGFPNSQHRCTTMVFNTLLASYTVVWYRSNTFTSTLLVPRW